MGDSDNNFEPSKKRAAGVQLSRDNLDDDEETSEQEGGTFKRASDEVLASRRIVKVRRQQTSTPSAPPASNPFAAIRLVPPTSAPVVEIGQIDKNDGKTDNEADDPKGESNVKPSESKALESKVEFNSEKDESDVVVAEKVAEGEKSANGAKKATEDNSKNEADKDVEGKRNNEEKGNGEITTEKNADTSSFGSFRQLSSSQNAFSGFAGTGFSSTSFSFGSSIYKDGSPLGSTTSSLFALKNDQPSFGFGISSNGNSSIFGTSGANIINKSESDKFPSMPEVPVETGEENEKAVFTSDSVLFEFIDGTWKERGKGELKVNVSTNGPGKARLVMRARGNYRLILNTSLFPDMKLTNMDKKGITFACVNSAGDSKDGLSTIALKFKDASIVEDFRAAVMEYKSKSPVVALKTPENSP
ncbi:hypothetical protein DH2020_013315 [Rehmannia glutinosa]|uniref:RanBD1 domain-containing protein n=1 Tax=Rehmannia glutinosa TaxID=99300 RepID=A0ABR0X4G0_REHGL